MKKNITINLCGCLFNIDEDAYELLKNYIDTLRNYFRRHEGDEEIANDIEQRVSELFNDLKASGVEAITIEHVQEIIRCIGELKDITEDSDAATDSATENNEDSKKTDNSNKTTIGDDIDNNLRSANSHISAWIDGLKKKRFYLDSKDKILAGVLSGCANYFGGSALAWRLCYLLLLFIPFIPLISNSVMIISYIIVAIIAPTLRTPEDCLRMKGVEVTPQTLGDEVANTASQSSTDTQPTQNNASGCFSTIISAIGIILALFGILLIIPFVVFFCTIVACIYVPEAMLFNIWGHGPLIGAFAGNSTALWTLGFCVLAACLIPAYCAFHFLLNKINKVQPMGYKQRILWIVLWLLSVAGIVAAGVSLF